MSPIDVLKRLKHVTPSILGEEQYKKYALFIPLVQKNGETHLLFEVRSFAMRSQPGDVCFPGGKVDQSDKNALEAALRETEEELGVKSSFIQQVTPLDYIVSEFGRIIYPFVGEMTNVEDVKINRMEVEEVFTVPLSYFLSTEPKKYKVDVQIVPEKNFPFHLIQGGKDYDWRTRQMKELFYEYDSRIIWGLTARIIDHFVTILHSNDERKE